MMDDERAGQQQNVIDSNHSVARSKKTRKKQVRSAFYYDQEEQSHYSAGTVPRVVPLVRLRARDQFVALLAFTHPRCGAAYSSIMGMLGIDTLVMVVRLVWDCCHQSMRFFCASVALGVCGGDTTTTITTEAAANNVITFGVSPMLGSLTRDIKCWWDDRPRWCTKSVNHCNVVEMCFFSQEEKSNLYYLRSNETGRGVSLRDGVIQVKHCQTNGKWFVCLEASGAFLMIYGIQDMGKEVATRTVPRLGPRALHSLFFFSRTDPDEGVMCSVQADHSIDLIVIQIEKTWASRLTVLASASFLTTPCEKEDGIREALVMMEKGSGKRVFILHVHSSPEASSVCRVAEGITPGDDAFSLIGVSNVKCMSQLSESLFCVQSELPPLFSIWDIDHIRVGALVVIDCSAYWGNLVAEGGFLFGTIQSPGSCVARVTDPSTGTNIIMLATDKGAVLSPRFSYFVPTREQQQFP